MKIVYLLCVQFVLFVCLLSCRQTPEKESKPWEKGAFETREYRNLFAEAGYSQEEIDAKLNRLLYNIFEGPDKVYFEVGDSLAYISDLKNKDVRTEGMSYGLMIAVQFDRKNVFDRLWRWSVKYMQHREGPLEGYFAWSCQTDGIRNAQGPASDGELYFVTALLFASNQWGNDMGINYLKEAQYILDCAMSKENTDGITNFINMEHKLINFVPDERGNTYTDPSYHIPAFYEVWARWAYDGRYNGTPVTDTLGAGGYKTLRHSLGLVATSAAISLACSHPKKQEFIHQFWNAENKPYEDGYFDAYYDGLLQLFSFMHLSGKYRIIFPENETLSGLIPSDFETEVDGKPVGLYILKNKNGLEACITNYGGRLISLMVPDRNGNPTDVVVGSPAITDYLSPYQFFGALVGRYANRIADAAFTLHGVEYKLQPGGNGHCLHSGTEGLHTRVWDATQADDQTLELSYLSPDGESGFPGNLHIKAVYTLTEDNAIDIRYEAITDKPTVINVTNHSYFNLSGVPNSQILEHLILINADSFTPLDDTFIPTGTYESVEGTPMDLRKLMPIGAHIDDPYDQLLKCKGYDHNWILNSHGDINKLAAKAISITSGIIMEVYTNEPGIQFYTNMGARKNGKRGVNYPVRGAFCLETQHFPNSPNQPNFPSTLLRPGESFLSRSIYKFSVQSSS